MCVLMSEDGFSASLVSAPVELKDSFIKFPLSVVSNHMTSVCLHFLF